jgi:DNA-binding beta-propeller fold protein YncE
MSLHHLGFIDLPTHLKTGGFDHAAVHTGMNRLYVAHTANDALDVIDCVEDRYLYSIPNLPGISGALVSEDDNRVFTSNRAENTIGIFSPDDDGNVIKIPVGIRPNGLSYDPNSGLLLAAHVGDPNIPGSTTISLIHVPDQRLIASIPVPGRTRWTIFDPDSNAFYVNIMDPAQIIAVNAARPIEVSRTFPVPAAGPHGLDIDASSNRLFCACDDAKLVTLEMRSGDVLTVSEISGVPDVIFYNPVLYHLYVAAGDPGVIDVFDTRTMTQVATIETERGAHTLAFDARQQKVYAFLPETHRAAVYVDRI